MFFTLLCASLLLAGACARGAVPSERGFGFQIENWDTEDGLPHNSVTCLTQSRQGYLWFGTLNGLVRTDGVQFKVYSSENSTNMPGNRVLCVFEDSKQVVWFGVEGGGAGMIEHGIVRHPPVPGLAETSVTSIMESPSGNFYFGTVRGEIIQWSSGLPRVYDRTNGLTGDPIVKLVVDDQGQLWAATTSWLGCLKEGRFVEKIPTSTGGLALTQRREGGLWTVAGNRLSPWPAGEDGRSWELPLIPEKDRQVRTVLENRKGEVWIGLSGGGLLRFRNGQFESVRSQPVLPAEAMLALTEDDEGNLWAGTHGSGLVRVRQRMFDVINTEDGLAQNNVLTLCESASGAVWLGTDGGGLHRLERDGKVTRHQAADGLPPEYVNAVYEDRQGTVWAGTWGAGLFRLQGSRFEPFNPGAGFPPRFIRSLYEDADGSLWIGTLLDGVFSYNGREVKSYSPAGGLSHPDVRTILRDRTGAMWFGTGGGGLTRLKDGRMRVFTVAQGLPSEFIRVLFEDEEGILWVGTAGGLACRQHTRFLALKESAGLPDSVISQIFKDERGTLWLGSNRGIFRASARELAEVAGRGQGKANFLIYTKADGLSGGECNSGSQPGGCRTRDGRLWFPTLRGVTVADPRNLKPNPRPPRVVIEAVIADGITLPAAEPLVVPAGCQRLEIQYTGLSFSAPRRVRFRHRLVGLDADWVDAGTQRLAVYNHVPPGNHEFQVTAANSDGVWNTTGTTLGLVITPAWWRTWWFLSITTLTGAGFFAWLIRWGTLHRIRLRMEQLEQQNALARERSRIAADMHDELGSRLTRIGLEGELARREAAQPERVLQHLDKMTIQSREVARALDEIVWTVSPQNDTLDRLAGYIVHYVEEFFEASQIRCRLEVPTALPTLPLSAERRHNFFLAFKEALNNVAKHSGATQVRVALGVREAWVELTVSDNGRGFDHASATGHGLLNMRERLAVTAGEFALSSSLGIGTTVTLRMRIEQPELPASETKS